MFNRKIFKKKPKYSARKRICQNNLIDPDKKKHLKGGIIFGHCREHDTIIYIFFILKVFLINIYDYWLKITGIDNGLLFFKLT